MLGCERVLLLVVLVVCAAINGAYGSAMVTGTVFCDQCKDGHLSLFDYPLNGVKVRMVCPNNNQMEMVGEETTNMLGSYTMRFDGSPNLSACFTTIQTTVTGAAAAADDDNNNSSSSSCQASAGPAHSPSLVSSFFGMEFYTVDALLSQPAKPTMSLCSPPPPPVASSKSPPPPPPPTPVLEEASACSHQYWMMPKYRCHWRVVKPDMKVGLVFGPLAASKYGGDMTLWSGLQGRADPYNTLLREAITALLNSYNSPLHFPYTSLQVVHRLNMALTASSFTNTNTAALQTALTFKRANSGYANSSCKFKSCE